MKLPVPPTNLSKLVRTLLAQPNGTDRFEALTQAGLGAAPGAKYRHWDTFRHAPPSPEFSAEEAWIAVKFARRAMYRRLPLLDTNGVPFQYALPNPALEMLHQIDRNAGGNIQGSDQVTNPATRDTYLFKSVVEEAITSSQLEGASTTRKVAKAMIQEGRTPRTRSERMIANNYEGMLFVRKFIDRPLTPDIVMELQRRLTDGTLDDPTAAGRFRLEGKPRPQGDPGRRGPARSLPQVRQILATESRPVRRSLGEGGSHGAEGTELPNHRAKPASRTERSERGSPSRARRQGFAAEGRSWRAARLLASPQSLQRR